MKRKNAITCYYNAITNLRGMRVCGYLYIHMHTSVCSVCSVCVCVCVYFSISIFSVLSGGYGLGTTPGERTWTENNK